MNMLTARRGLTASTVSFILLSIIALLLNSFVGGVQSQTPSVAPPESSPTTSPTVSQETCEPEFKQVAGANEMNKVDSEFEKKVAAEFAKTNNMVDAVRTVILESAANNGQRLAIWSHPFGLFEDPNSWQALVEGDCLSDEGQKLYYQLEGALTASGTVFEVTDAPADGYNSGVHDGTFGVGDQGITGNRTAVKITLPDGTVVVIMVRCGNVVYPGPPPGVPEVPTDEKDPSKDPAAQGNAPVGGGLNEDPGPGTYIPPAQMEKPPATPRVNPAPPAPAPPASNPGTNPAPVPTPDPAPAPAPEPSAPTPEAPAQGCSPPPGMTTC